MVVLTNTCWFEGSWNRVWSDPEIFLSNRSRNYKQMETFEDRSLNQFFGLESTNLIHFRGKFMTKSHKGFRIIFTHFISKTPHHSYNVGRSRIPVNALRPNIPVSLNIPKIMFLLKHVLDHFTLNSNNLQTNRCLLTPPFLRRRGQL